MHTHKLIQESCTNCVLGLGFAVYQHQRRKGTKI